MKQNCWDFKKCGRQPGGPKASELGVCTAATEVIYNGKNGGKNSGRYCWKVAGTLCGGKVQGTWAQKMSNCNVCDFMIQVKNEEGAAFKF